MKSSLFRTFESEFQKIFVQKISDICSFSSNNTVNSTCKTKKKSTIECSFSSQKLSIFFATSKNRIANTIIFLQLVSSNCSNLSIATFKITSKCTKSASEIAKTAKIFAKSIANIRVQTVRIRVKRKIECSNFKLQTLNFTSKSMKKISIQQIVCVRICKRCKQNFNFNNKFHEHIREHHARKSVQNLNFRVFASKSTCKIKKKSTFTCSSVLFVSQKSSIFFATLRNQLFSTQTVTQFLSSKCSNFSIATYKINSKSMKSAIVVDSLIFSFISSHNHIQKFYLIANDLSRMFVKKSKSFNLRQHHNRRSFQQNFDIRQFRSIKLYLIIENLFEMFDEKFRKKNLFQNQNNVFFQAFSDQMQIIVYFKFKINQKSSVSQISKNSKSKISKQHMFAKSIRTVFSKNLSKKSIKLLYKMLDVFEINSKVFFFIFILFRFFSIFFLFWHSFRSFQLQKWVVLTFINKLFRSWIVSISNLSFRNETNKRRKINCSNIQSIFSYETSKVRVFKFLHSKSRTKSRKSQQSFVCLFRRFFFATFTSIFESISSKCSHFFIATFNITSKSMKKLSVSFFQIFVSKHQKFYLIIHDLIRMFREKFKSFDLRQHQKNFAFSQNFDICSFNQSRFFFMHQSRKIVYFLSAINQKTSINQNLKNSKSKSFQQFTRAKTIRFDLSKKSI